MKKNLIIICCLLSVSIASFSQNERFKRFTPDKRAKIHTELMQKNLDLNPDQVSKIASINLKYAQEMEAIKDTGLSRAEKLGKAIEIQVRREDEFAEILTLTQLKTYISKKKELMLMALKFAREFHLNEIRLN